MGKIIEFAVVSCIGDFVPDKSALLYFQNGSDLINTNNQILQAIIILLVVAVFSYSAKMFYEWMSRK